MWLTIVFLVVIEKYIASIVSVIESFSLAWIVPSKKFTLSSGRNVDECKEAEEDEDPGAKKAH